MVAKVLSSAVVGLNGIEVEVETDILSGLPTFTNVGLPDKAVEDAKERVRSALVVAMEAIPKLSLFARSFYKILKIAQTIADLEDSEKIREQHILESLQYRPKILFHV